MNPSTPSKSETKADTTSTGTTYRFVGDHAVTFELADGTLPSVGPGDFIDLSPTDYDAALAHNPDIEGHLLDTTATE